MKIKKRVKKSHSISARLKLREEKYVVIYHRNKLWRTGIVVNSPDEFNLRDGVLKANYRGTENYEVLNVRLKEQLGLINKLINDAVKQGLDTLKYIDVHHRDEETKLKKLHVAKNTPLVVAFAEYLKIKKEKVKKIQKDSSFDRYKSELSRLQDYNKGRNINVRDLLDIDWFYDFAEYLSTPKMREYEIYDSRREMTYKCTKEIKQTNSTIARFLQLRAPNMSPNCPLIAHIELPESTWIVVKRTINQYTPHIITTIDNNNHKGICCFHHPKFFFCSVIIIM